MPNSEEYFEKNSIKETNISYKKIFGRRFNSIGIDINNVIIIFFLHSINIAIKFSLIFPLYKFFDFCIHFKE